MTSDDRFASELRGFGPVGILAILLIVFGNFELQVGTSGLPLIVPLGAALVLVWARLTRTPWREIGFGRPESWLGVLLVGVLFGTAFKLLVKSIAMPLLGAPPVNSAYHFLAGHRAVIPVALFDLIVTAGFGEETVFRGFFFERLGKLLGSGAGAKVAIVLITSLLFGLAHYSTQGLPGAEQGMIVGLVFGAIYAKRGRLWVLMFAHAAFDLTALALIYWDLEPAVSRLFFH